MILHTIREFFNYQSTIFKHQIIDFYTLPSFVYVDGRPERGSSPTRSPTVLNSLTDRFELVVPLINVLLCYSFITKGFSQHFQRDRTRIFIPQTKFDASSLLNKITHCKNGKINFWMFTETRGTRR